MTKRLNIFSWVMMLALLPTHAVLSEVSTSQDPTVAPLPRAEARERNLRTYVELMRSDIRTQKVALITELMVFSEAEDAAFWPIYREFELETSRINDERIALIETYGDTYPNLTDAHANDLVVKALGLEARRTALKQKYHAKLKSALSPRLAAKALYIEQQLELLIDLQVAAALPVLAVK